MKIVLIGIQGSGKGTLVDNLRKHMEFDLVSTGQMLRDEIATGSDFGKKIAGIINAGNLVSLDIILDLINKKLSTSDKPNLIFDGFPRDLTQAEELRKLTNIDLVINLELSKEAAIDRLLSRLTCKKCGFVTSTKVQSTRTCPNCGGELVVRDDENEASINKRFEIFYNQTLPILQRLKEYGVPVVDVDTNVTPNEVLDRVLKVIDEYNN